MKKFVAFAAALCMAVSLAACGSTPSSSTPASASADTPASETSSLEGAVTTGGSTSVEKVILALQESFMASNPGVDVTYDPTGSGAGITGASEGTLDIGLSSRALKEDETGLVGTTFALDGIAIIVNNENTVSDLSLDQIKGLADGSITNWSEVGGPDAPVVLIGREAGSGTRDGFESIVGVEDVCVYEQELTSTGAVSAVDEKVKAVTVDGVAATEATVQDGSYKVQRPFVFVTKEGAELSDAAKAFIDFALSADAHQLIIDAGAVPLA